MSQKKYLWRRLESLQKEYRTLSETPPVPIPYSIGQHFGQWRTENEKWHSRRLNQMQKEISALSGHFNMNFEPQTMETPSTPRITLHSLPPGRFHPVTPQEVMHAVEALPPGDTEELHTILLCDARRDRHASYNSGRIKLFYPVDEQNRVRLKRYEGWGEVRRFGAKVHQDKGERYLCWDPLDLKSYVLGHLLLHEIGHHVAWLNGLAGISAATRREEDFAENYAYSYSEQLVNLL